MRGKTHCTIGILSTIQACILFKIPISIFNLVLAAIFSILPDLDESNSTISNVFLKQDASKLILKIVIYIINFAIFFISLKINNNNFFLSSIVTFIAIMVLESKINHILLRKILLSLTLILLSLCLFFIKVKIYFVIFFLMLASFPWLKHRSFSHSIFAIIVIYFLLKQIEIIYNISNLSFFGTIGYASHLFLGDLFTKSGIPLFYPISNKKYSLGYFRVGSFFYISLEIFLVVILVVYIIFYTIKILVSNETYIFIIIFYNLHIIHRILHHDLLYQIYIFLGFYFLCSLINLLELLLFLSNFYILNDDDYDIHFYLN